MFLPKPFSLHRKGFFISTEGLPTTAKKGIKDITFANLNCSLKKIPQLGYVTLLFIAKTYFKEKLLEYVSFYSLSMECVNIKSSKFGLVR